MRCTVVGAGVIGLSCAIRLREAGHEVRLVAERPPAETTSAIAAALWYPYLASPPERVLGWGATTYAELVRLAETTPTAGVRVRRGRELFREPQPDPWWQDAVPDLARLGAADRPPGYADGWTFTSTTVDMPVYLAWLLARLEASGVRLELRRVDDLDELLAEPGTEVVVSCPGLGARTLVGDASLLPVRGQVLVVEGGATDEWWLDDGDGVALTYVIPRLETIVVGGTALVGVDDLEPVPSTADEVLARASALVPGLADARVLAHRVGLRPRRPEVRLDVEDRPGGRVVHCYGHGGAGVTLSWGCADEIAGLVG